MSLEFASAALGVRLLFRSCVCSSFLSALSFLFLFGLPGVSVFVCSLSCVVDDGIVLFSVAPSSPSLLGQCSLA